MRYMMYGRIRSQSKRSKWIIYPTFILALINFLAYIIISLYLGGDALNGYVRAGHYLVCAHGGCTEISGHVWQYSYWHTVISLAGIFLVFVEGAFFVTTGDIVLDFDKHTK